MGREIRKVQAHFSFGTAGSVPPDSSTCPQNGRDPFLGAPLGFFTPKCCWCLIAHPFIVCRVLLPWGPWNRNGVWRVVVLGILWEFLGVSELWFKPRAWWGSVRGGQRGNPTSTAQAEALGHEGTAGDNLHWKNEWKQYQIYGILALITGKPKCLQNRGGDFSSLKLSYFHSFSL